MPFLRPLIALVRAILWLTICLNLAAGVFIAVTLSPGDWPFAPLDLDQPIGLATHAKLASLADDGPQCRALLLRAGAIVRLLPPSRQPADCPMEDVVLPQRLPIGLHPAAPPLACPLAAALLLWERQVVQPAARATLDRDVVAIDHLGTYSCRRVYGRETGPWSRHAEARAIDVAGFRLADGSRISVARDWKGGGPRAAFLRRVRDGGCRLFSTTLSPDYNAAHHDHFHLDLSRGWGGFCA